MNVAYTPKFLRLLEKLPLDLQEETIEKIELFKNTNNHEMLKVHKLKGSLKEFCIFSVDYKNRIIFEWASKDEAVLLAVDDHDIYKK